MRTTRVMIALAAALASVLVACSPAEDWVEQSTRWRLVEAGPSGRIVVDVLVGSSTCDRFVRLDVEETDERVEIIAIIEHNRGAEVCTMDLGTRLTPLSLRTAIDPERPDRELVGCDPDDATADCYLTGSVLA